jgi:hypothetical protein
MGRDSETAGFIRSIRGIIERIPFATPVMQDRLFIDPSGLDNVPQYLKSNFKIMLRYKPDTPFEAACLIYSPKKAVTVVIVINKKYETLFNTYLRQFPSDRHLVAACERRSLYMHETCHLAAAIRLFPSNYDENSRKDFVAAIEAKFGEALKDAEGGQFFTHFERTVPPFIFNDNHFQFRGDRLSYNDLYQELMISDDEIKETVAKMFQPEMIGNLGRYPRNYWIAMLTHIDPSFFGVFQDKREKFRDEIISYSSTAA